MSAMIHKHKVGRSLLIGVLSAVLLSSSVTAAPNGQGFRPKVFRSGSAFQLTDLPDGNFRQRLHGLPAQAQQRAMNHLHRFTFTERDLPHLRSDNAGDIYYADTFLPTPTQQGATVAASPSTQAITATEAFALHSKPGSSKVVYLDFNGHAITGTAWNSGATATFNALPYDLDGNSASFSAAELSSIAEVWRRIAEDYAPFDVDITTQEPVSFTANTGRVLITKNTDANSVAMPASTAGGVAYVNVWGASYYSYYSPALVYYNNLGGGRADYVAEAASHELGHNLGLSHDATSTTGYFGGMGSGYISWGPIMGTGYNRNVSQWSKGEYTDASNTEDDVTLIATKLTTRADEHSNTSSGATAIVADAAGTITSTTPATDPNNATTANKGVIQSSTDVDTFYFDTSGGNVTLKATPAWQASNTRGADLDIHTALRDSNGSLVIENDKTDDTDAVITTSLLAGRYYLSVEGVGNLTTPYSDYGSLGQFFLSGSIPVATAQTQTISFGALASKTLGTADFAVSATASSGLPVSFSSQTPSVCSVSSSTVHLVAAGTCTIRASQAGNSTYSSAPNVDQSFTVSPVATPVKLTVIKSGSGTVNSTPTGITCGSDCTENYSPGIDVTLSATPAAGYVFTGWSGACTGMSCTVTMDAAKTVTANFTKAYTLTVKNAGNGTVTSLPTGISCGSDCTETYNTGTSVTLTAQANPNARFISWSGCTIVSNNVCTVSMTAAKSVTATFKQLFTLNVSKTGNGSGKVTGTGITCDTSAAPDCTEDYLSGASTKLTATPDAGHKFTGWTGCTSTTSSCAVVMSEAKNVTANFDYITFNLTANKVGNGTVSSTPAGITCGANCTTAAYAYRTGTPVTLTAIPDAGYKFTGWTGCSSVSSNICTANMTATKTVTATFKPLYTLTVSKAGNGLGKVTGTGITCDTSATPDCTEDYTSGTTVTLSAKANTGSRFTGWSGICAGITTCKVSMSAAQAVTANFTSP
ncbi:MAG: zinc-dependent metalloprotease family protein [Thiothrix sp.]|uniref:InlB B-repeat-containing protein n=1 Tax=Thiothrix sp. TaxID=1032 RepID=UPI002635FBE3|nr:zinc-dependent metalloprotease family protein [Thiothrix sp.]MDD5395099.1 zinc-dependent metalloprotease family protein [Thiothrix sp.]